MTSNIPEKDLELPFDLYVHAAKKDYEAEISDYDIVNEATNNYITCSTYETVRLSKQAQKESNLANYIKINGENKQFLSRFISGILTSAKDLYELGGGFIYEIEGVKLSEHDDKYIRDTNKTDENYNQERIYRLNLARINEFVRVCDKQLTDTICSFANKVISNVNIPRNSTLANARMQLDDDCKKEDKEVKLIQKLKTAMDNAVYGKNDIYRGVVINTVVHFIKCLAYIVNKYVWHNHRTQSVSIPTLVALFATHGLGPAFIKEYTKVEPKSPRKPAKKAE